MGVIDERGEIRAADAVGAGFDLGRCSDIVTGLAKLPASMLLLRGMNPEIIAMDEITQPDDIEAVKNIIGCGVHLFATLHADGKDDMLRRPLYQALLELHFFSILVSIRRCEGKREYRMEHLEI